MALEGGGDTPIPGLGFTMPGATTAAYRVSGFPTTVLIDSKGMLVGELTLRKPEEARRRIEECLEKNNVSLPKTSSESLLPEIAILNLFLWSATLELSLDAFAEQ